MQAIEAETQPKSRRERTSGERVPGKKKRAKPPLNYSTPEFILQKYKPLFLKNNDIIVNAKKGLDISAIADFSILSGKNQKEIAALIHTTAKTLQNYSAGSKKLPTLQSELLLKLFALYEKGIETFEGVESFKRWLHKPAFGLYHDVPNNLIYTSTGINLVIDELIRIQYGDFA